MAEKQPAVQHCCRDFLGEKQGKHKNFNPLIIFFIHYNKHGDYRDCGKNGEFQSQLKILCFAMFFPNISVCGSNREFLCSFHPYAANMGKTEDFIQSLYTVHFSGSKGFGGTFNYPKSQKFLAGVRFLHENKHLIQNNWC